MSQENVEAFKRAVEANNGGDYEAFLQYGAVAEFKQGKVISYRDFFDHAQALEAAGLQE